MTTQKSQAMKARLVNEGWELSRIVWFDGVADHFDYSALFDYTQQFWFEYCGANGWQVRENGIADRELFEELTQLAQDAEFHPILMFYDIPIQFQDKVQDVNLAVQQGHMTRQEATNHV